VRFERFLEQSKARHGDKAAVVAGETRVSYAELDALSSRMANALSERGVRRDDRVVIFLENSVEAVVALFGVLKAGATFSIVNPTTKEDKLAYMLNNCRARGLVTHEKLRPVAAAACERSASVTTAIVVDPAESDSASLPGETAYRAALESAMPDRPRRGIDIDLGMIIYTSGSTGFPKGVMMTHQNMVAASTSITTYLENSADDIILSVLPLSFDYGLYQVLMGCQMGATVVLEKSFAYPFAVLQKLARERATGFPLVPTMAAILVQMKDLAPGSFPHLRYLTNTAAALPPAHIERLQHLFPTTRIYSMYGLTECKRCTYLPPEQLEIRPGSVGKAIPGTEAYVIDERGNEVAPGVVGQLVIRGAHVMQGYWENPEATDRMLKPGKYPWEKVLHTGDLFRKDEEGFLYFVGRSDDIIKTRGEKVSPKEVESVLHALAGVREAAVVGVPDPVLGSALKAVLALSDGCQLSERDVQRHCARHLEDFMVPKYVEFRAELPKTDTGKIRRKEIQDEVLAGSNHRPGSP
jgi:amino acid adenylation domain-containing protein